MSNNFSRQIVYNKKPLLAAIVPQLRPGGMQYEVNIKGYPRFYMAWSALGRYDITGEETNMVPYEIVLAVSDEISTRKR